MLTGMEMMTDADNQISMAALREGRYEAFGAFNYIRLHGSLEGKMEALNFINERYLEVIDRLNGMKNQWTQAHQKIKNLQHVTL